MMAILMLTALVFPAYAAYKIPDYETFSDGLLLFFDEDAKKYGYMDTTGAVVISPQFALADTFNNGTAAVSYHNPPKSIIINKANETLLEAPGGGKLRYEFKTALINGAATASVEERKNNGLLTKGYVLISESGKLITPEPLMYIDAYGENGLALVGQGDLPKKGIQTRTGNRNCIATLNGNTPICAAKHYYFIDKAGKQVGDTYEACREFSEGLAAVQVKQVNGALGWGFIDAQGNQVVPPKYESVGDFREGRAAVTDGKVGLIDQAGAVLVEPKYDSIALFSEGLAVVSVGEDDDRRCGYIDSDGNEVIGLVYTKAYSFKNGLAAVQDGLSWGIIDTSGNWVIAPKYSSISQLGNSGVFAVKQPTFSTVVNENGDFINYVANEKAYEDGASVTKVVFPVGDKEMVNFVDTDGDFVCINSFDTDIAGQTFCVRKGNGLWGLIDRQGNEITPAIYQSIASGKDDCNIFRAEKDDKFGYITADGEQLTDCIYDKAVVFDQVGLVWKNGAWDIINPDGTKVDFAARAEALKEITDKATVKRVQEALNSAGYDCGKPDGSAGKNTQKAILAYQTNHGLTQTGTVTGELLQALGIN